MTITPYMLRQFLDGMLDRSGISQDVLALANRLKPKAPRMRFECVPTSKREA